jgi:Ca2+-binding EF-hand superfamily protein
LEEFKATTTFQSGVLSFMINLKSTSKELEELNKMFLLLDTSKDGILSA